MVAAAEQVAAVGAAAEVVADGAAVVAPPLLLMSNGGPGDIPTSGTTGSLPNPDFDIISAMQHISDDELTHLVKNYNGIIEHNGHPVEFNFQHIFEAESIRKGKN